MRYTATQPLACKDRCQGLVSNLDPLCDGLAIGQDSRRLDASPSVQPKRRIAHSLRCLGLWRHTLPDHRLN